MKKTDERPTNVLSKTENPNIPALVALKGSQGWKIISDILKTNIEKIERAILDADDNWTPEKLTKWRDMRFFEKQLLQLPDKIIEAYNKQETTENKPIELDPYKDLDK